MSAMGGETARDESKSFDRGVESDADDVFSFESNEKFLYFFRWNLKLETR